MSDCCDVSTGGSCEVAARPGPAYYSVDGTKGKAVDRITPEHLLQPEAKARLWEGPYYFCPAPACPVVYFGLEPNQVFYTMEVTVPVWQKDAGEDVPACYCFRHTRRSITDEILQTGKSTVQASVTAKVKAGECACEITNPQGSCCLGNVAQVVKDGLKRLEAVRSASPFER